jgi:membrane-associated PAP2 superfamily phosphatase
VGKQQHQRRTLIAPVLGASLLLCLVIAVALTTQTDRQISDLFFNPVTGRWLIDHDSSSLRPWFYDGPKLLIIVFGIVLAITAIRPTWFPPRWFDRREALFLFACLAVVPLTIGTIRKNSNVQCPVTLQQYGGTQSNESGNVSLDGFLEERQAGGCWPSGHASGGFALLCLAWLNRRRRIRYSFAVLGLTAGLSMGTYQVARGAHFASHVLVTGLIAILLIIVLSALFGIGAEVPAPSR